MILQQNISSDLTALNGLVYNALHTSFYPNNLNVRCQSLTKLTVGQKTTNAPNGQNPLIIDIDPFKTIDMSVGPVEIDEETLKSGKLEVTQSVLLKYGLNKDNLSFDLTGAIILKYECLQKESCWELKLLEAQVV